jgi:hypothetical protein
MLISSAEQTSLSRALLGSSKLYAEAMGPYWAVGLVEAPCPF